MPRIRATFLILYLLLLAVPVRAHAAAGEWQRDSAVAVRLISADNATGTEKTIPLGLEVDLGPDWHTYWRSPGAAGLPPAIDWKNSLTETGNLEKATLLYPAPKRYSAYGLETIGYRGHIVFPIDAELHNVGRALRIDAALDLLICSNICLPKHFTLKLDVPAGMAGAGAEAPLIAQYRALIPGSSAASGLGIESIANDGQNLTVTIHSRDELQPPDIFAENDKNIDFGAPTVTLSADKHTATLVIKPVDALPAGVELVGLPLTLTVTEGERALEQKIMVPPVGSTIATSGPAPKEIQVSVTAGNQLPLGFVILLAIMGGFILNLMPCVLPVLSLKILSVISHGGGDERIVRHSFLVTAAGILFSYLALAGVTMALKECGLMVGWGVQFQQPLFLIFLVILLTFFAASMWDLFDIRLPRWLADNLPGPYHPKLAGDFATGAFATLLATPCSAPFLGTAVGFALASGPREILLIFAALGFGMMLPYLVIALWPHFATSLPKPGVWMVYLRHALGVALAVTAVWLIWVLAAQITARSAFVVAISMLGILGLLALHRGDPNRSYLNFGILSFMLFALGITVSGSLAEKPRTTMAAGTPWAPFDASMIGREVTVGHTVFVDVTADWCLTCKANEKLVLSRADVRQRLFHTDIVAMQADWTNPDPKIAAFLHKYGRYGIPFNAVFGPAASQGILLPELLTEKDVLNALDRAEKPQGR